jgi:hypothetical protein
MLMDATRHPGNGGAASSAPSPRLTLPHHSPASASATAGGKQPGPISAPISSGGAVSNVSGAPYPAPTVSQVPVLAANRTIAMKITASIRDKVHALGIGNALPLRLVWLWITCVQVVDDLGMTRTIKTSCRPGDLIKEVFNPLCQRSAEQISSRAREGRLRRLGADRGGGTMRKSDVTCPGCKSGYLRIELATRPGKQGEFRCRVCSHLLELFDGSREVAYRLTVQPSDLRPHPE